MKSIDAAYITTANSLKTYLAYVVILNIKFSLQFAKNIRAETHRSNFLLQGIVCIPPHTNPTNGAVTCSDRSNEGSRCDFTCNANYALNGSPQSVCRDDGTGDSFGAWSSPAPTCDRKSKYRKVYFATKWRAANKPVRATD